MAHSNDDTINSKSSPKEAAQHLREWMETSSAQEAIKEALDEAEAISSQADRKVVVSPETLEKQFTK